MAKKFTQEQIASFANLVAKVWEDKATAKRYQTEPGKVLQEHGIRLPTGVPVPRIPPRPRGAGSPALGATFRKLTFENWELAVHEVGGTGGPQAISVSSLACFACPVSCFSSISN